MNNREKCKQALHDYIDSMDDSGIFEFIAEQSLQGTEVYGCSNCESDHGAEKCDEPGICKKRFLEWITK